MPVSKHRKNHKKQVEKFKQKQKSMTTEQTPQLPEVRNFPVWKSSETLELNGMEFEAIFNFVNGAAKAYEACQSIMNKGLLNGTIKMAFEKLVTIDGEPSYERMTDEESAPLVKEFEDMITNIKNGIPQLQPQEESIPRLDAIVDAYGNPVAESVVNEIKPVSPLSVVRD